MELYNEPIDEFVDWVSGENSFTGEDVTGGALVSGLRIRELLQNRLKKPIHVYEDQANNKYRIFSSKDSYDLWTSNPSDYADLELFTIPRPSDYKLTITLTNDGDRYITAGDDSSPLSRILFSWSISNDEGPAADGLTVTYTITHTDGTRKQFIRRYNHRENVNFSIYDQLGVGINNVEIQCKGNNTGATFSTSFNITVLDLLISCGFDFAAKHSSTSSLNVPYRFYRNNLDGTAKIYFIIDDGSNGKTFFEDIESGGVSNIRENTNKQIYAAGLEAGLHTLQIYAEALYNGGQVTAYSNLLYYTFTIASNETGSVDKYINIATSYTSGNFPLSSLTLHTTQYYKTDLRWGYYTDAKNTNTKIPVVWKLLEGLEDENPQILGSINANTSQEATTLEYIPTKYTVEEQLYICAYFGEMELVRIPVFIVQNEDLRNIKETAGYELKMSAYGKTNDSLERAVWKDSTETVSTTFTNISWNPNSGWYDNSFRTIGTDQYAIINFKPLYSSEVTNDQIKFPFKNGKTIEIDFESEKVSDTTDKLIVIGDPTGCRIEITPNAASLYDNFGQRVIYTNYKANERIKLAFIINKVADRQDLKRVDDGIAFIVNNGILERGSIANGRSFNGNGNIKIGGSNSGIRVYSIRVYDQALSYTDAYSNFVYDSDDKMAIVTRNNILSGGDISYDLCRDKIDTILITGDLSELLLQGPDKTSADVMIERTCPYDQSKDFIIGELIDDPQNQNEKIVANGARIRKHGQSTLNYPITSLKFWLNKADSKITPIFSKNGQTSLQLNKNRYKMKNSSIPANKFVLQANYADSSGVHNGGLLRLIQKSWYNALIDDGEGKKFLLRTEPQLFTSLKSNERSDYTRHFPSLTSVWADTFDRTKFPYEIEVAPDSFPCAVFYYDLKGTKTTTFLGQYVFMEDKKSDYNYGERSIYKVPGGTDPFCMTVPNADRDKKENCLWDNENVLRIEVLEINNKYSSYTTTDGFETFTNGKFGWELSFEMIYPDPEDVEKDDTKNGLTKASPNSKFQRKTKPFVDWYKWLLSTRNNQQKFQDEAADHLDLYKMAAYYIFVLRFALVDSLERNAQIKTYDGVHFHYEPWDMDIALGNKNDGGIAYAPPVDRNTKLTTQTYAISGRAADENGDVVISNWLWDALEAWPYWANTIVPKVADALYEAGLKYGEITDMFDEEYANKWCEIMYNKSGYFKYVQSAGGDLQRWLNWLQGARMSHRHWWLSTSMDYYDAKWFCGDYKNNAIYIGADVTADASKNITFTPNTTTYMTVTVNNMESGSEGGEEVEDTRMVSPQNPLVYNLAKGSSNKAPVHIYGANFVQSIDMGDIASGIVSLDLTKSYSKALGAPLKHLDVGTRISGSGNTYTTTLSSSTCGISPQADGVNAFENLETLNIRGHIHLGKSDEDSFTINTWTRDLDMSQLKNFYAMGSTLTNFYSSDSGNIFQTVELPSTVTILNMKNSSWQNLEFWDTTVGQNDSATLTKHSTAITGGGTSNIPSTLMEVHLLGTTGSTRESLLFVRNWIKSIVETEGEENLWKYTLDMNDVQWTVDTIGNQNDLLTYHELELISKMNGQPDSQGRKTVPISGYVILKYEGEGTELTSQQLTNIRTWFGDTVFTKGSSGLVVDYIHAHTLINVGGQVTIDNGEIYLTEGDVAMLSATTFLLSETPQNNYSWGLVEHGTGNAMSARVKGVQITEGTDGNTYLESFESQGGSDYDVDVNVSVESLVYTITIHVIAAKYPTAVQLDFSSHGRTEPRYADSAAILWQNGAACNIFAIAASSYTATVKSIVYTVTSPDGDIVTYSTVSGPSWLEKQFIIDGRVYIEENVSSGGMSSTPGIVVGCSDDFPTDLSIYEYGVSVEVTFKSNKKMSTTGRVIVMDDGIAIVTPLQEFLYDVICNKLEEMRGEEVTQNNFYRADLVNLTGTLIFGPYNNFTNIVTNKGSDSLLDYLSFVTSLIFDDNTSLVSTSPSITENGGKMFVFDRMPQLLSLRMLNCSNLTEDIDLTPCTEIQEVDVSGTSINVILPANSKVTKYELGSPSSISIVNPTLLQPSGVVVDSCDNLTSLEIRNIKGYNTFAMFTKITQSISV